MCSGRGKGTGDRNTYIVVERGRVELREVERGQEWSKEPERGWKRGA